MPAKLVIRNSITEELNKVPYVEFEKYAYFTGEETLFDPNNEGFFPNLRNCVVFVAGIDAWHKIKQLHDQGLIHIGLRHFNFSTVTSLTYVSMANDVKLVVSPGYVEGKPDWSKIEVFRDSNFDTPVPVIDEWEIVDLKDSERVIKKLKEKTDPEDFIGFDFETRGFPLREGFKPLGFSLVGRDYGVYINIRDYTDWNGPEYSCVRAFIEENYKRLVVYNCKFEILVCEHMWGEKLNFPDAMALVLCDDYRLPMRAPKRYVPGLKPCAQHYLHVASWDDALEFEQKYFGNMCYRYSSAREYFAHMAQNEEVDISKEMSVKLKDGLVRIMNEAVERYCSDNDIEEGTEKYSEVSRKVKQEYKERIVRAWGNEWEMSDPYTLGKYCIYDSFYTKLIWDYLKGKYPNAEEIYHGNYHYGAFIEDTAIPINRERLETLINYAHHVKANTGVFLVKFYLQCLEDTISDYVDNELSLTDETKHLMVNMPWVLSMEPSKVIKEIVKSCKIDEKSFKEKFPELDYEAKELPITTINWMEVIPYTGKDLAREIYKTIQYDTSVASAMRRHRKEWESFGQRFGEINNYRGLIERINQRNLNICKPYMKKFNQDIKEMVAPFDPNVCKMVARYFEEKKLQSEPWKVMKDYPDLVSRKLFDFVKGIQKEWNDDYWATHYLGGRDFKKMMGYINDSWYVSGSKLEKGSKDLDNFLHAFNFFEALPTTLLLELPDDEIITAKEVVDLIHLREMKPILDKWDTVKIDGEFPQGITEEYARWLSEKLVVWSSEDETRIVAMSILKKYGWLCSAITQFWNYWWSPDHKGNEAQDPEVLAYAISSALEDKDNWYVDFQEYFYGASKQVKKDERAVDVAGFCRRFGFERSEIRQWDWFNLNKDSTLHLEEHEDRVHRDWRNLYKFILCWELYGASTKQLNPYLTRMDEDSGTVVGTTRDNCEIIREGVKGERFLTKFGICAVTTKRSSGFFHTFAPGADELSVVQAPEGKLLTYFDVSQAEPRMMAYMSHDENFMDDYNQGKDIYMQLAQQYRPDLDYDTLKKRYRGKCKTLVLAIHYGMAIPTLSHNLDMTLEETENLVNSYYSRYSSAKKYIDAAKKYCKENGEIKTVFGDKLYANPKDYATAGINYVLQNSASVLMQHGFNNMDYAIRQVGIELHPKSVIHDSNQNEIWIKDLFYVDLAYRRFFRQYIREVFGVDFKYDLELLRTFRDHVVYGMDYETGIMTLNGSLADCEYFEKYLTQSWNMELVEEGEMKPASEDLYLDYSNSLDNSKRGHQYCMNPIVKRTCPNVEGRKWKINHDWDNDEIVKKINSLPFDVTYVDDIFAREHDLSY